jgi:hypothetical protein
MRNTPETQKLVKNILWDLNLTTEDVFSILSDRNNNDERRRFVVRLLRSYNWYTLLKIFTIEEMIEIINDNKVINALFPNSLKEKYMSARKILSTTGD